MAGLEVDKRGKKTIQTVPDTHYQTAVDRRCPVLSSAGRVPAAPHCVTARSLPITVADPDGPGQGHPEKLGVLSLNS